MKKHKIWDSKHYDRMQKVFESQGIKADFSSMGQLDESEEEKPLEAPLGEDTELEEGTERTVLVGIF